MRSKVHPKYTTKYRVGNWSAYEQALVQRGDVTLWLSADATDAWRPSPSGRPGAPKTFSDCAIETALTLRLVFRVPVRQAEGFLRSVLSLMGVDLAAPDHTTLSRRSQSLAVEFRRIPSPGPIHRIVDSTGLSIVGEGEWAAVNHGGRGHRGWKTLHLAVDRVGVIVAHALTEPTVDAATIGIDLIETVDDEIARVTADAAYETVAFYAAAEMRDATVVVPPSKTARVSRRRPRSRARVVLQLQGCDVRMDHLWQAPYRVPHHAQRQSVQMAPVRTRPHPPVRSVVPAYALSYRDLEDMMRERGLCVDHTTIYRWVQRYAPEIDKRCRPFLRRTNDSYRIDETYVRVAGAWTYLYRGVDSNGDTLDFLLRATRDRKAAIAFFRKTLGAAHTTPPRVVTVDKNPAYPVAFEAVRHEGLVRPRSNLRQCKYLNNIIEQDHRFIKRRTRPMLGFKRFTTAWRTLRGLEIMHALRKGQARWMAKGDVVGQTQLIHKVFGLASPNARA